jgi:hypothetical protein
MKNPLGPNWKPRLAALFTVFFPPVLFAALTNYARMTNEQATQVSGEVMAVLASLGLAAAKGYDVSHSPRPMACSQQVAQPPSDSPSPPTTPDART